jgi:hypothetical protein
VTSEPGGFVYLASPYSHPDPAVREARFDAVARNVAALMRSGVHLYSPITHTHPIAIRGDLPTDWSYWEGYDRVMIAAASELWVLMIDGWGESRGVAAEIAIAVAMHKPVRFVEPLNVT